MSSETTYWGVWLHAARPVADLAELAAHAEHLGAAAILVADEGTDRDLFVTLAAIAQRTQRANVFAAVTNPHSRHPVATAAAFASLAELAPGRIVAGFGTGGSRVFGPMALTPRRPFTALVDALDIVQPLLRQERVTHHGEVSADQASLPWSTHHVPIAIAGRGPRVERLAAERADWFLLAGRAVDRVPALATELRGTTRHLKIAWNPSLAWTLALEAEVRGHLAYMVVDMPHADRLTVGVNDALAARLKHVVATAGPEHAGPLLPPAVLDRFAIAGCRASVIARLRTALDQVRPELVLFEAHDYSRAYVEDAAELAHAAGAAAYPQA
jgi:5,10-methylenetetrahydromethanopterin reductase